MAVRLVEELRKLINGSESLLGKLYVLIGRGQWGLDEQEQPTCYQFTHTYYEIPNKLVRRWPEHPRSIDYEKVDRLGSEVLWRDAHTMVEELEPLWGILQEMAALLETSIRVLAFADSELQPLSWESSPELLSLVMLLVSNIVRLHLLARRTPYAIIVQLYTLTYKCAQVQQRRSSAPLDPPNLVQTVSYCNALAAPVAMMQSEFQPVSSRIGQILEVAVLPAVSAFCSVEGLQSSHCLNCTSPEAVRQAACANMGFTPSGALRALQNLSVLHDWALLAVLVCPGEVIRPGAAQVIKGLLANTLIMPVYKEVTEWLHPLYSKHVQPTLRMHYLQVKQNMAPSEKKALKRTVNNLVDTALSAAEGNCMERRRSARAYLAVELDRAAGLCSTQPAMLPAELDRLLAMLLLARDEILWLFQHLDEEPPKGWLGTMLSFGKPLQLAADDASVPFLFASMSKTACLLNQHRGLIQAELTREVREILDLRINPSLLLLEAAAGEQSGEALLNVAAGMRSVADALDSLELAFERAGTPPSTGDSEEACFSGRESMEDAREAWEEVTAELSARGGAVTPLMVAEASGFDTLVRDMSLAVQRACLTDGFDAELKRRGPHDVSVTLQSEIELPDRASGLVELSFQRGKLGSAMASSLAGSSVSLMHAPAWLYPIACLATQPPESDGNEEAVTFAETLAEQWDIAVASRLEKLLLRLHEVDLPKQEEAEIAHTRPPDPNPGLWDASKKLVYRSSARVRKHIGNENTVRGNDSLVRGSHDNEKQDRFHLLPTSGNAQDLIGKPAPTAAQKGEIRAHWHFRSEAVRTGRRLGELVANQQAARCMVQALGIARAVRISEQLVVHPGQVLLRCVAATVRYLITILAFDGKIIRRPTVLEKSVARLLLILHSLQPACGADLATVARDVLIEQAYSPLSSAEVDNAAGSRVITYIAEWYLRTLIRDSANLGVSFSKARRSFVSKSGAAIDLSHYASEMELRAFVRVFGLYGAREMARRAADALQAAVGGLHSILAACQPVLQGLSEAFQEGASPLVACRRAANAIPDLQNVVELLRIVARCLFLRQLLAAAVVAEAGASLPQATALLSLAMAEAPGMHGWHACDILDLPQPGTGAAEGPSGTADPALVHLLAGGHKGRRERLICWGLWPFLLGLSLWSPAMATAFFCPALGNLLNGMDCISICAHALATALPEVTELGTDVEVAGAPPADLLCIDEPEEAMKKLVRVATSSLLLPGVDSASSRLLIIRSFAGPILDRSFLEEAHVLLARTRTACSHAGKSSG